MEWAMRKKGIPDELVRVVVILYKGARTKVKVGAHLLKELEENIRDQFYHHCCLPL